MCVCVCRERKGEIQEYAIKNKNIYTDRCGYMKSV